MLAGRLMQKRNGVGDETARAVADEQAKRMGGDELKHRGDVGLAVEGRFVHLLRLRDCGSAKPPN